MLKNLEELDKADQKIVVELLKNARQNYSQIAKNTSLSKEVVRYRIQRLEHEKIIRGYKTLVDFTSFGGETYELLISLKRIDEEVDRQIIEFLEKSDILGYGDLIGYFDYDVVIYAPNHKKYDEFKNNLKKICSDNLEEIEVLGHLEDEYVFTDKIKQKKEVSITETEKNILKEMINNARIPLKELSDKLKKSFVSLSNSIKKMEKAGIIKAYYPDINFRKIGLKEYSVYIKTKSMDEETIKRFREAIIRHPNVFWYVRYIGKYDFAIQIIESGVREMRKRAYEIISLFKDYILETKTVRYLEDKK
ncbi:MAG: Lrp/AsnC family transcriptional regulator [Candidatus Nanoarchaeia archaeon]